jgi:hypothetical protein
MISATRAGVRANHVRVEDPGSQDAASLTFDNGLESFDISIGSNAPDNLLEASLADPVPVVAVDHNRISIEYPLGSRLLRRMERSRIRLSPRVSWSLDVHSGATQSTIDLSAGQLSAATFHSGVANSTLLLPHPDGECLIRLQSVQQLQILRPTNVPIRLELERGATAVDFDRRHYQSASRYLSDESEGFAQSHGRYVVTARSGVSGLTIGMR